MNAISRKNHRTSLYNTSVTKPAIISGVLHVGVFLLAMYGLPFITKDYKPEEVIIPIEMFDPSEIIETPEPEEPKELVEPAPAPERKPVYNNSETVPDFTEPEKPPEIVEKVEPPEPKEVIPDPSEIKTPPKPKSKPKPPKRPEPVQKKPEPKEEKPERDINSLLKSLTPDEPQEQPKPTEKTADGNTSSQGDVNRQMTSSDLVALVRGVQPCWNVNAGGRFAENLVVKLRVAVNRDRTVRNVDIIDSIKYSTDSHFRSAADAAKWALLDPNCTRLNLPEDKYETWKSFIFVFDPSQML